MVWFMVLQIASTLVELTRLRRTSGSAKDLRVLLLRRQWAVYERKQRPPLHQGIDQQIPTPQQVEQRAARRAVARFWAASFMITTATLRRRESGHP